MFCTSCGNKLEEGARFCDQCGEKLTASANETPGISAPQAPIQNNQSQAVPVSQAVPISQATPPVQQAPAQNETRQPAKPASPKKKRRWGLIILCIVLGLALVVSGAYLVISFVLSSDFLFGRSSNNSAYNQPSLDYYGSTVLTTEPEAPTEAPTDASEAPAEESVAAPAELDGYIAFITDYGTVDDQSYNQYTYEGIRQFAEANNIAYCYYRPTEDSEAARHTAMDQAIVEGARVIVCAGYMFDYCLYESAIDNPEILYLGIDVDTTYSSDEIPSNVVLVTYREEQAGFLAGYAAVMGGYTKLGFLGGMSIPVIDRYGYGFIQGADAAAAELGIHNVEINYWYAGVFYPTEEALVKMDSWYSAGTEIVFVCGGGLYDACIDAANANDGWVIGVDVDQSNISDRILTSAMKDLSKSARITLEACSSNGWQWPEGYAGKKLLLGVSESCVGLPMENTFLPPFAQADYDAVCAKIRSGEIIISDDTNTVPQCTHTVVAFR